MRETLLYPVPDLHQRAQLRVYPDGASCAPGEVQISGAVVDRVVWCVAGQGLYISSVDGAWGWCVIVGNVQKGQILVRKHEEGVRVSVVVAQDDVLRKWLIGTSGVTDAGVLDAGAGSVQVLAVFDDEGNGDLVVGKKNGTLGTVTQGREEFSEWSTELTNRKQSEAEKRLFTPGRKVLSLFSRVRLSPGGASPEGDAGEGNTTPAPQSPVAGIAKVGENFLVLHGGGEVACYGRNESGRYGMLSTISLGLKASGEICEIVSGGRGAVCVVSVDEAPHGDSVRAIEIGLLDSEGEELDIREVAVEKSPLGGRVVGVFVTEGEAGNLRVFVGLGNGEMIELGKKKRAIWTARDEISEKEGMWKIGDAYVDDTVDVERLLCPGRFSTRAISRALRVREIAGISRGEVEEAVRLAVSGSLEGDVDTTASLYRVNNRSSISGVSSRMQVNEPLSMEKLIQRAERATLHGEKFLTQISVVDGLGVFSCRDDAIYVVRALTEDEEHFLRIPSASSPSPTGKLVDLVASGAYGQIVSCKRELHAKSRSLAVRLSQRTSQYNAYESLASMVAKSIREKGALGRPGGDFMTNLTTMVAYMYDTLKPGAQALVFLTRREETEALPAVTEAVAEALPASSLYARALTALERHNYDDAFACFVHAGTVASEIQPDDVQTLSTLLFMENELAENIPVRFAVLRSAVQLLKSQEERKLSASDAGKHSHKTGAQDDALSKLEPVSDDSSAFSAAAAAAVEAMAVAPTLSSYEQMRASAFTLYLSAQNVQGAIASLLKPTRNDLIPSASFKLPPNDQAAIQDSISLLTAACMPLNMTFLTHPPFPEYVSHLVLPALWNLARSTDPLPSLESNSPYMYLYAYLLHCNNPQAAASAAVELSARIQALPYHPDGTEEIDRVELQRYAKGNTQALTLALSATRILGNDDHPVELTSPTRTILAGLKGSDTEDEIEVVVNARYIRRRLLLAKALEGLGGRITGLWGVGEGWGNRVEWTARALLNLQRQWKEAAELIAAWKDDLNGPIDIYTETVVDAVRQEMVSKGWDGVAAVLEEGDEIAFRYQLGTGLMLGLAGLRTGLEVHGAVPRWLEARAARESLGATCRVYVLRGKVKDAARILVTALQQQETGRDLPFVAVDGVLKLLDDLPAGEIWKQMLTHALERKLECEASNQNNMPMISTSG